MHLKVEKCFIQIIKKQICIARYPFGVVDTQAMRKQYERQTL